MKKVALAIAALTGTALALEITGAGATFPYPVYGRWVGGYLSRSS